MIQELKQSITTAKSAVLEQHRFILIGSFEEAFQSSLKHVNSNIFKIISCYNILNLRELEVVSYRKYLTCEKKRLKEEKQNDKN